MVPKIINIVLGTLELGHHIVATSSNEAQLMLAMLGHFGKECEALSKGTGLREQIQLGIKNIYIYIYIL